ncbi:MAG: hypothetical protein ACRDPO_13190 [Streptosporangiaceae bacterium]
MSRWSPRSSVALLAACGLAAGGLAAGGPAVVTVLGSWTGDEQSGFLAMVRGFERRTGIQVDYTGTRDADAVLASDLKDGNPPDLACCPGRGSCARTPPAGRWPPSTRR